MKALSDHITNTRSGSVVSATTVLLLVFVLRLLSLCCAVAIAGMYTFVTEGLF